MKHSVFTKFIAILLAACCLTGAVCAGFGVALLAEADLYSKDLAELKAEAYENRSYSLAVCMAESYSARTYSGLTQEQLQWIDWGNSPETISMYCNLSADSWRYTISDSTGAVLEGNNDSTVASGRVYSYPLTVSYPVKSAMSQDWDERTSYYPSGSSARAYLYLRYEQSDWYTVDVWMAEDAIPEYNGLPWAVYEALEQAKYVLLAVIAAGLLLAAVCIVYLCCAAGKHRSGDAPQPGGLNRLPLDLYAAGAGAVCVFLFWFLIEVVENAVYYDAQLGWLVFGVLAVFGMALCMVGFVFAWAAQWKMHGFYVWGHSLTGWLCRKLYKGLRLIWKGLCKLYGLLPTVWQYLLIGGAMGAVPLFFFYLYAVGRAFWMLFVILSILADILIICYGAYAYGTVLKGARRMADGALYTKIDTKYLIGSYRRCAEDLNALADVAVAAAKNQMKSERMKTELITNVSHDIKTPLTSIINYIDLLQKAENAQQSAQYLEVLDRQSQRLKKLIDDLMEMSKATTGNMPVELTAVDAVEAVNQALGEFADKMAVQDLTVVFHHPQQPVEVRADGRLTWRVLSNLLSNAVKYALPGTRVYVDMLRLDGRVQIALKNISREELNVSADELTERFVRGDASRNTEGSGLGLNIAQSLMELQKGRLELTVDGDLFKVTLTFPTA